MIRSIVGFALTTISVLVFGYIETKWRGHGIILSVLAFLYMLRHKNTFSSFLVLLLDAYLRYQGALKISYLLFFIQAIFCVKRLLEKDEIELHFKPFEKEIRRLLLSKDPAILHEVDGMLVRYKGHESELYDELISKYGDFDQFRTPNRDDRRRESSSSSHVFQTPEPILNQRSRYNSGSSSYNSGSTTARRQVLLPSRDRDLVASARDDARRAIESRLSSSSSSSSSSSVGKGIY